MGKTSLLLALLERLPGSKGGFYTREIRDGRQRVGFQVNDLAGHEGVLAHVNLPGPPRVGRYGVDLEAFDAIGVRAVSRALPSADLIVIDEIGKMELYSPLFQKVLFEVLESARPLLGTIMAQPHPVADRIKAHPDVRVKQLTQTNRQEVAQLLWADISLLLAR